MLPRRGAADFREVWDMAARLKRLLCIALAMVCLASCGMDASDSPGAAAPRKTEAPEIAPARDLVEDVTEEAGWSALRLTEDDGEAAVAREGIYLLYIWDLRLLSRDGESDKLICTLPEGSDRNARAICSDGSGVFLALYFAEEERCEIRFYSEGGDERAVTEFGTDALSPYDLYCDGERLYLYLANFYGDAKLLVLSRDGEQEYELDASSFRFLACGGGHVYVWSGEPAQILELDNESRTLSPVTTLNDGHLLACTEETIYIGDETSVYEMDARTLETRRLLDWVSCGISGGAGTWLYRDGENFIVSDIRGIFYLTPREGPARRRVVLGVNGTAHVVSYDAMAFNMENDEYEIIVRDYGVYEEPQVILGAELASGKGPDIIDARSFSPDLLRAGVMTDLMTLLENDGEIGPDDLLSGPLRAMQTKKSELFAIAPSFTPLTYLRHTDGAGTLSEGMREFVSVADSLEELGNPHTTFADSHSRESFLERAFCRADGAVYSEEDIKAIFEYAAQMPLMENKRWLGYDGIPVLNACTAVSCNSSMASHLFITSLERFGDEKVENLEVFGLPFCEGTGLLDPSVYLAIPYGAGETQGAWEYIKFLLRCTERYDLTLYKPGFDAARAEFERGVERGECSVELDIYGSGDWVEYKITDMACYELFEYILDGLGGVYVEDDTLLDLVNRGAAGFFAGETTADEAARAVCSRLELYLGEKYG